MLSEDLAIVLTIYTNNFEIFIFCSKALNLLNCGLRKVSTYVLVHLNLKMLDQ